MVKKILVICLVTSLLFCCTKKEDAPNPCQNFSSFSVSQLNGNIHFSVSNNGTDIYEISYSNSQYNSNPENGSKFTASATDISRDMIDLGISPNTTFSFYVRKVCNSASKSDWSAEKTLQIANFCNTPTELKVESNTASWRVSNFNSTTSYSQVQYGLSGFTLGAGTIANSNSTYFYDAVMVANNTYDFYVRNYCTNNLGFSNWVGPYTYYCSASNNVCTTPTNVNYTVVRNSSGSAVGANFTWVSQGLSNFEYVVVAPGSTISQSQIKTISAAGSPTVLLSKNTNYTFYVRGLCGNGVTTNWSTQLIVNIGN